MLSFNLIVQVLFGMSDLKVTYVKYTYIVVYNFKLISVNFFIRFTDVIKTCSEYIPTYSIIILTFHFFKCFSKEIQVKVIIYRKEKKIRTYTFIKSSRYTQYLENNINIVPTRNTYYSSPSCAERPANYILCNIIIFVTIIIICPIETPRPSFSRDEQPIRYYTDKRAVLKAIVVFNVISRMHIIQCLLRIIT